MGYVVEAGIKAYQENKDYSDIKEDMMRCIENSYTYICPSAVKHMIRKGKLKETSARAVSALNIVPILTVDDGQPTVHKTAISKKAAINTLVTLMDHYANKHFVDHVTIMHVNDKEGALELKSRISGMARVDIDIKALGPVLGCHLGLGSIGLAVSTV